MNKGKVRVLIVDDEPRYVLAIQVNLEGRGYEAITASNGRDAVKLAAAVEPDLVMMDIRMPDMDGFEACRRIREFSNVPIIMLTALADKVDKVKGLDLGADDYMTKPFDADELGARIRAIFRRTEMAVQPEPQAMFEMNDLQIDFTQRRVFVRGEEIRLSATEYRLLAEFAQQSGRILVPDYLLDKVWGSDYQKENSLVRQAIHRLRGKIELDAQNPQYIQTRPGLGYVFTSPSCS